jgi:hypothetical protein
VFVAVEVADRTDPSASHYNLQPVVLVLVSSHKEVLNRQDMAWDNYHSCQVLSRYHSSIVLDRFLSSNSVQMGLMVSAVAVVFPAEDMPDRLDWRYNQRLVLSVLVL